MESNLYGFIRACNEGPQKAHKLKIEEFGSFLFVFISEPSLHIECTDA